jgi:outer membrane protein assembly factor BamA
VDQKQYLLAPLLVVPRGSLTLSLGPIAKYSTTDLGSAHFIGSIRPYGSDDFGQVGATGGLDFDTREPRAAARKGVRLRAGGSFYPPLWSVKQSFGETHGDASLHLPIPIPLKPSLGFRVGAKKLFGLYPFHEAAYLGGTRSVRGMSRNRFAGDAFAFGNAEFRLRLLKMLGVFALADTGRVFLDAESSDRWHNSVGGGLWLAFRDDKFVVSFTSAKSEGHTSFYVKSGLAF